MLPNILLKIFALIIAAINLSMRSYAGDSDFGKFASDAQKLNLLDRLMTQWTSVNRWLIEYEIAPSSETAGFSISYRIMAVAAPGDFYHMGAHVLGSSWQTDPFCQEYILHQGHAFHIWPFNRAYSEGILKSGEVIPGSIPQDVLLTIIPKWPLTDYKIPADNSGRLVIAAEAIRSVDYRLLSKSELISGEDCSVFDYKGGVDRIWIAINKGGCVMRREFRDSRSMKLVERIETDKVDQVVPGLWLPRELKNQYFPIDQDKNEDAREWDFSVHILRFVLNSNVPESTFIPTYRPGSIKFDDGNGFTQISPGGKDLLDDIVNFMLKRAHLPSKSFPHSHPYRWLLAGVASGFCLGLFLVPKNRSASTKMKA
jgi:hypothetical protein